MAADGIHETLVTDDSIRISHPVPFAAARQVPAACLSPIPALVPAGALIGAARPDEEGRAGQVCSTANSRHRSGTPLSVWLPRSAKPMPEPRTSICTVLVTRTSPAWARAATRAPTCTASPVTARPVRSTSPVCRPARTRPGGGPAAVAPGHRRPDGPERRSARPRIVGALAAGRRRRLLPRWLRRWQARASESGLAPWM